MVIPTKPGMPEGSSYGIVFDIETDGLEDELTKVHCISYTVLNEEGEPVIADTELVVGDYQHFFSLLRGAAYIVGHNILGFDLPVLHKLYPEEIPHPLVWLKDYEVHDTSAMSRVLYSDMRERDAVAAPKVKEELMAERCMGSHRLKAWGIRLDYYKGDFGDTTDWAEYTDEMGLYCIRDVDLNVKVWQFLTKNGKHHRSWLQLEHQFKWQMEEMMRFGVPFNVEAAERLATTLHAEKKAVELEILEQCKPTIIELKTPEYWTDPETGLSYRTKGEAPTKLRPTLVRGPNRTKEIPFNPGSRKQIGEELMRLGWVPKEDEYTDTGLAKISESILADIGDDIPLAYDFHDYLLIDKRLSQLEGGTRAWLKVYDQRDHRIYGRIDHNATVTHRCAHFDPNLGQVPAVRAEWGKEMRGLFGFTKTSLHHILGADLSGLELRMLGQALYEFDGGEYMDKILEGDIHTYNQELAGLPTRDAAKLFIYALIYGAGNPKLGAIVGGSSRKGASMRRKFMEGMPAFGKLVEKLQAEWERWGHLTSPLDGRPLPVRGEHMLLNVLLQSSGAIVGKMWNVLLGNHFRGEPLKQVLFVHDEVQYQTTIPCSLETVEQYGKDIVKLAQEIPEHLELNVAIDAEFKIGKTWADTH